MLKWTAASCLGVAAYACMVTSSGAQINAHTLTLAGVSDCIAEAIATNAVEGDGTVIAFSCTAAKARTLYHSLGRKVRVEIVQDRKGKFENRAFGSSVCAHRIEDPLGNAVDEFRCDLIMAVGEALGE